MTTDPSDHRTENDSQPVDASGAQAPENPDDSSSSVAEPFSDNQPTVISKRPRRSSSDYRLNATPAELGEVLEGRRLDYFQLEEFVGGGGMGAVFRAIDTKLGRTVAVKVLSPYQTDEANLKRFKNEAQSAARLDHANIARVYYVGEDDGWHFIVFEFIEGVNLRDLVNHKGPLPVPEAITYTLQAAAALDHASTRDLVHRDIKPSNVLITPQGQAKVVDMGLARLHHMETNSADLTASGVTLGTFDYISPEQARDPRNADVRSDLYSLGCTLYYMLTGMPPFPGGTVLQKLLSHSSETPAELGSFRDDLDADLCAIVDRMLAKQPAERYQTPTDLIADLSSLASKLGMTDTPTGISHWAEPHSPRERWIERHLPWAAPLAALVLVVIVLERVTQSRSTFTISEPRFSQLPFGQENTTSATPSTRNNSNAPATGQTNPATSAPEQGGASGTTVPGTEGTAPATGVPAEKNDTDSEINNPLATEGPDPSKTVAETGPDDGSSGFPVPPTTATGNGATPQPTTVIVQPQQGTLPATATGVESLDAAIELVQNNPSITTIEIASNTNMEIHPFTLRLGPGTGRRLTIRGSQGTSPLLVFRPTDFDLETPSPTMIQVIGGNLTLQNIHLRLELPAEFRQSWTVFGLQDTERLLLERSSITVTSGAGAGGSNPITGVAFFEFLPPEADDMTDLSKSPGQMPTPVPQLILQESIARGPATLVRTMGAIPFKLRWNNGLLATNERLLETIGSETKPRWQDGIVDIELQHVTVAARQGLCLMKGSERRPYAVEVMATLQHCIIITDPTSPLYLQQGFTNAESVGLRPKISGSSNYYQNTDLVLKVQPRDLADEDQLFTFEYIQSNRNSELIRSWYDEINYRPGTMISWREQQVPPSDLPLPQQTITDYLLNEQDSGFEMDPPGAIAAELPVIPLPTVLPVPTFPFSLPVTPTPTP
ncbi:MAG: protein kinase [Pirellulaceae bacterium]